MLAWALRQDVGGIRENGVDLPGGALKGVADVAFVALFLRFGGIVVRPGLEDKQPVSP